MKSRKVRVYIALTEGIYFGAIHEVMHQMSERAEITNSQYDADIVIFDDEFANDITFLDHTQYMYITFEPQKSVGECSNIQQTKPNDCFIKAIDKIEAIYNSLSLEGADIQHQQPVELFAGGLNILVVDSDRENIVSARRTLLDHRVVAVDCYYRAMEVMVNDDFDVVLTELHLLDGQARPAKDKPFFERLVPNGLRIMLESVRLNVKKVAVVSASKDSSDPFNLTFNHFRRNILKIDNTTIKMVRPSLFDDGSIDWSSVLQTLQEN